MAKVRRAGFGTVFQVENETVGIGTTANSNTVQVIGNVKSSNANVIGIATLPTYKGFLDKQTKLSNNEVDLDNLVGYVDGQPYYGDFHVHNRSDGTVVNMVGSAHTTVSHQVINDAANLKVDTLSGDIIIDGEFTVSSGTTYCTSVDQLTVTSGFAIPTGTTEDRIHCHTAGSMRFNEDLGTLEFYTGDQWKTVNSFKDIGNRGRVLTFGGKDSGGTRVSNITSLQISTLGNAIHFGNMSVARRQVGACASEVRALTMGGSSSSSDNTNEIHYYTIASESDAIDFGDLLGGKQSCHSLSSSTRGISYGSGGSPYNQIDYVEIGTLGNAIDFGDTAVASRIAAPASSPIRGFKTGGTDDSINRSEKEFISISSKGNGTEFGDMRLSGPGSSGVSNNIRAVIAGGYSYISPYPRYSDIEYFNMISLGESIYFGDLGRQNASTGGGNAANQVRGLFTGGYNGPTAVDKIDFITFASTGNALDFGNLSGATSQICNASDSHGGLGGF
tara:strand:+ start:2736 stop:4244 length:1509 start_codon:yes stop_codon:yes gene_type:complete